MSTIKKARSPRLRIHPPWMPIETAPKDGRAILLLSAAYTDPGSFTDGIPPTYHPPRVAIGQWDPEGTSWVDEWGQLGGDCYTLATTGFWTSGGGWFQPNEGHALAPTACPSESE